MRELQWKPLLLTLPLLVILFGVILADSPESREGADSVSGREAVSEAEQEGQEDEAAASRSGARLELVIGKAGSLDNDIGVPIYAEPEEGAEVVAELQYNCCVVEADPAEPEDGDSAGQSGGGTGQQEDPSAEPEDGDSTGQGSTDGKDGWLRVCLPQHGSGAGAETSVPGSGEVSAEEEPEGNDAAVEESEGETASVGYLRTESIARQTLEIEEDGSVLTAIALEALRHIGVPFAKGEDSLETGIDCSHFVQQMYRAGGVAIPDQPQQIRSAGEIIEEEEARPGDVVFYDVNDGTGHVAIYLGEGLQISAMGHSGKTYPEGGVRICRMTYRDRPEYELIRIVD